MFRGPLTTTEKNAVGGFGANEAEWTGKVETGQENFSVAGEACVAIIMLNYLRF